MNDIDEILSEVYSIECTKSDRYYNKTNYNQEIGSPTYGEITYEGVEKLVQYFKKYFNKNTVFYDLGCGLGKMVTHIGLKYGVKKSCGIEYSKERYMGCMDNYSLCKNYNKNIEFINGSYFDIPIDTATVVYVDDTAFLSEEKLKKLHSLPPVGCLVIHRGMLYTEVKSIDSGKEDKYFPTTYCKKDPLFYYIKT